MCFRRLCLASEAYHHVLSKKKDSEALEDAEKLLPIDTLGIVMITHGEEIGDTTAFGAFYSALWGRAGHLKLMDVYAGMSLVQMGRAHCKIATLQESYSVTFRDTFLSSMDKFKDDIKEYDQQRKKLESRRYEVFSLPSQ